MCLYPLKKIEKTLMALEYNLGYAAVETLVYDLENYGVALAAGKAASYTLNQVENAIKKVLADEAATLVVEQLTKISQKEE
jgi:hypothetical protein